MNRIRELRLEKGMKQSDLAEMLSVSRNAISNYEVEIREIDAPTIRTLCGIFGCTADYLLGISGPLSSSISNEEAALLEAYKRTPQEIRNIIDAALAPYREDATMSTTA